MDVIASSVVQHRSRLLDAKVKITIEIEEEIPSGFPTMSFGLSPRIAVR
jgi:hypothetical protein